MVRRRLGRVAGVLLIAVAVTGCAVVHRHDVLPDVTLGEASFYPTLQAYADAPIVGGNRVDLLLNGVEIFPAMLEAIRSARASINYAQYFFEDGLVARDLAEALAERCRAGIAVNVLLDGVGTLSMPREYEQLMKRSGCHVATYRPVRPWLFHRANKRNHRRLLIVDGQIGFTGGSGVSRKWMGDGRTKNHWRDTDVRIEGSAVEWLQAAFAENWLETTGIAIGGPEHFPGPHGRPGGVDVQVVRSSPRGGSSAMYSTLLIALGSAKRSIRITNPYLLLDERLTTVLLERAQENVSVEVLVPGAIDHNFVREASRASWGRMLEGGIRLYQYAPALLHAKTIVIDSTWTTIGSTNLDPRSLAVNEELNVIVYDRAVARKMDAIFAEDVARSKPVTLEAWKRRGIKARLFETLVAPLRQAL
jgi:cardiolipin synthase A/B